MFRYSIDNYSDLKLSSGYWFFDSDYAEIANARIYCYFSKETVNNKEYVRFLTANNKQMGEISVPANHIGNTTSLTNWLDNSIWMSDGGPFIQMTKLNSISSGTTFSKEFYFSTDYFDLKNLVPYDTLKTATKNKAPIKITSLVVTSDFSLDENGTTLSFDLTTNAPSGRTYTSNTPGFNTIVFAQENSSPMPFITLVRASQTYYIGFKTSTGTCLWYKNTLASYNFSFHPTYFDFSDVFPKFYNYVTF